MKKMTLYTFCVSVAVNLPAFLVAQMKSMPPLPPMPPLAPNFVSNLALGHSFCGFPPSFRTPIMACAYQGSNKRLLQPWLDCSKNDNATQVADYNCDKIIRNDVAFLGKYMVCVDEKYTLPDFKLQWTLILECGHQLQLEARQKSLTTQRSTTRTQKPQTTQTTATTKTKKPTVTTQTTHSASTPRTVLTTHSAGSTVPPHTTLALPAGVPQPPNVLSSKTLNNEFCSFPESVRTPILDCAFEGEKKKLLKPWLICGKTENATEVANKNCDAVKQGNDAFLDTFMKCVDDQYNLADFKVEWVDVLSCGVKLKAEIIVNLPLPGVPLPPKIVSSKTLNNHFCGFSETVRTPILECAFEGDKNKLLQPWLRCGNTDNATEVANKNCDAVKKNDNAFLDSFMKCVDDQYNLEDFKIEWIDVLNCGTKLNAGLTTPTLPLTTITVHL